METWKIIGIVLALIALVIGIVHFTNPTLFSIAGAPTVTHTYQAFGHSIDVTSDFQSYDPFYSPGGSNLHTCDKAVIDASSNVSISYTGTTHNGGTGCNSNLAVTVKITDLDLSKYKSVVIHRAGSASGAGMANQAGYKTILNSDSQLTYQSLAASNYGTASGSLGDIYATNNGVNILVQASPENAVGTLYPADKALFLSNTVLAFGGQTSGATASLTYKITGIDAVPLISPPSVAAAPGGLLALLGQIGDWVKSAFSALFTYNIAGSANVAPGTIQTYHISLAEPYALQNDSTQGVYMQRWCDVALIDKNQNVLNEQGFTPCNGAYTTAYAVTIPSGAFTDYAIIVVMAETRQDWNGNAWTTTYQNKVVQKESLSLTSKVLAPPATTTAPSGLAAIWNTIINLFKNIFG